MNLKALFAIIGVLIVALFGYNYYSSKKSAEKIAAIQAETAKTKAELKLKQDEEKAAAQRQTTQENLQKMVAQKQASTISQSIAISQPQETEIKAIKIPNDDMEAKEKLTDIFKRWRDTIALASSTARIALAPVVKDIQVEKREAELVKTGECMAKPKEHLVKAIDYSQSAYLGFMEDAKGGAALSKGFMKMIEEEMNEYDKLRALCK